jgi:hypothetical protein
MNKNELLEGFEFIISHLDDSSFVTEPIMLNRLLK